MKHKLMKDGMAQGNLKVTMRKSGSGKIRRGFAAMFLLAGLLGMSACGQDISQPEPAGNQTERADSVERDGSDEAGDDAQQDAAGQAGEDAAAGDSVESDSTEKDGAASGNGADTPDAEPDSTQADSAVTETQCVQEIDALRKTEPVLPAQTELLAEMARCVTFARILDEKGVLFSEMDADRQGMLRSQVLREVLSGETAFSGAIPFQEDAEPYEADRLIPVSETVNFMQEVYGLSDFTRGEHFEQIEDGFILWSFGDGEPWEIMEHMQFFEDDSYILLTGPAFYEDNGGSTMYKGYADLLLQKNPDSRYGVTMVYGRYRDEKVNISSVDVSSELPAGNGKTYSGNNLTDGDYATVWVEGVSGTGEGESVTLHLASPRSVFGVQICNGYTADADLYEKNGKVSKVRVDFGGGNVLERSIGGYGFEGADPETLAQMNLNRVELEAPVVTDTVTITITGAEKGTKYDDTCISEVRVY